MSDVIDPPDDDDGNDPSNPFDPKRLRIAGGMSQGPTAKRILTNVQVRKPNRQEYFRTHPEPDMQLDTLLLEMRDDRLTYLVAPDIAPAIPGEALRRPVESAQYLSIKYNERLAKAGLVPSVGSVGDSYDNALAETINGLYKAEVIHRRDPWRSMEAVEFATLEWVGWFNNRRLLSSIGNIPPAEAEVSYWACQEDQAIAA